MDEATCPTGPFLRVSAASRTRAGRRVLDGVDLDLERGTLVALLGPNGAGKTSLIRAICGRLRLDQGHVRVAGGDPARDPAARRRLGLVPQELALYPDLSARENLEVFAALSGVPRRGRAEAVRAALAFAQLEERAGSLARTLSGGLQRRLNLAAALLHEPELLLLDEPTVGVDPVARERLHGLLRELRGRGRGLLLATHDLDQAAELADRIAIMVDGRVCACGTLPELIFAHLGGGRELSVRLRPEPAPGQSGVLGELGLTRVGPPGTFVGTLAPERSVAEVEARLAAAGLGVHELRLREPGLRAVFFRVTGREFGE